MQTDINRILFIDIETVAAHSDFDGLDERMQNLWAKKAQYLARGEFEGLDPLTLYPLRAGIFAEFGKIICITAGLVSKNDSGELQIRIKSFYGDDESELLKDFSGLLAKHYPSTQNAYLCGHNIKEFDVPYICRRMLINRLSLPAVLDIGGKKPYELKHLIDTMQMWKFGDYKHFTSLDLLAALMGVPSPKENMDGSMVNDAYWLQEGLEDIKDYCERDVVTTIQVYLGLTGMPFIPDDQIVFA